MGDVDQSWNLETDHRPVTAEPVIRMIRRDAGADGVEVDVRHKVLEIRVPFDKPSLVAALPQRAFDLPSAVVLASDSCLKPRHRMPHRRAADFDHEVIVIRHETPGEDLQVMKPHFFANGVDPVLRCRRQLEDVFASGNSVENVVNPARNEESDSSWHG